MSSPIPARGGGAGQRGGRGLPQARPGDLRHLDREADRAAQGDPRRAGRPRSRSSAPASSRSPSRSADGDVEVKDRDNASIDDLQALSEELTNVEIVVITAKAKLDQLRNLKELPRGQQPRRPDRPAGHRPVPRRTRRSCRLQAEIDQADGEAQGRRAAGQNPRRPVATSRPHERVKELNEQRKTSGGSSNRRSGARWPRGPVDTEHRERRSRRPRSTWRQDDPAGDPPEPAQPGPDRDHERRRPSRTSWSTPGRDLQRAEEVLDRIEETLNQYQFNARNPTARVELDFKATPSIRPNSDRRTQVMAAAPVVVGLLVIGPAPAAGAARRAGRATPTSCRAGCTSRSSAWCPRCRRSASA